MKSVIGGAVARLIICLLAGSAMLISSHLNFNFMRKKRRIEPIEGTRAYSTTASRSQPNQRHSVDILA